MYRVYKIINEINSKCYIGITSRQIEDRFKDHLSRARSDHRFSRLYMAMRKHGAENFTVKELVNTSSEKAVRMLEGVYIHRYDTYENGYNCNYGGHGFLDMPMEIRKKISESQKGKIVPTATRKKMSEAKLGDKSCAKHFGEHVKEGKANPRSRHFLIQFPDGHTEVIKGIRAFCREYNLLYCKLSANGKTKGFVLLGRFNDYPEREYTQASGSARQPNGLKI